LGNEEAFGKGEYMPAFVYRLGQSLLVGEGNEKWIQFMTAMDKDGS
jgi:hypothetical protein